MPAERVSMRRVREILRLKYEAGASDRASGLAVGVARSTARLCLDRVAAAGLVWPLPATLTDAALEALLFAGGGAVAGQRRKAEPDWAAVHRELRRPGVTLMLLWDEYRATTPGGYQYSRWCELYRGWEGRLSPTMRQALLRTQTLSRLRWGRRWVTTKVGSSRAKLVARRSAQTTARSSSLAFHGNLCGVAGRSR